MAQVCSCTCPTGKKEPAIIEVDTTGCSGDGPLTAEACKEQDETQSLEQGQSETFEAEVKEGEGGKYTVVFAPPSLDVYKLHIRWGGEEVEHSPLRLNLNKTDSKAVKISEPPSGNLRPGEKISIGFDTSNAGRGELTSTCSADDTGDIPVEVIRTGFTSHYIVDFLPPQDDFYTLYVRWSGKNVKGSPFKLDMIPVLPNKVVASNLKIPEPGGPIELDICTKGAGNAPLTATCVGNETGEIPVKLEKLPDSQYDWHLTAVTPNEPDTYCLDVKFAGQSIPDSPFTAVVKPPPSADKVEHISTTVQDEAVTLKFDASKAGEGKFRARVAGASSGPVDCTHEPIPPDEDAHYLVTFDPVCADSYLIDVYWNDDPVPDSPFNVIILRPELLKFGEPKVDELERPVELPVDASKAGPGTLSATCRGEKCGKVETLVEDDLLDESSKKHIISFRPSEYDTYTLSVYFDGVEVPQSPFVIPIEEPDPKSRYFLFGVSSRKVFSIGEKVSFGINASKAGEGRPNVTISGPSACEGQPQYSIQSSEEDPQIYHFEFVPSACGEHKIHVCWDEEVIPGSPVVFNVGDNANIPTHPITKPYKIFFTTDTDPKDIRSYGVHEESETTNDLKIGKRRNGKVKLTYTTCLPGIHSLQLLVDDQQIPGSPWRVRFVESDPKACGIINVPEVAYVGEEVCFTVDARKAGDGDLHVRARVPPGGGETCFSHTDHNNGLYTILFTPKVTGTHHFDISWAGTPLSDSPVTIVSKRRDGSYEEAKKAASEVHVLKEDSYVFGKPLPYSNPVFLCISTGHAAGKGKMSLRATGPSEAKITVYDRENGVYTAEIQPVVAGKYTLDILWNDIHIRDSPFKLNFTEDKSYLLNGLDLDNVPFVIDTPYSFHIHCPQIDREEKKVAPTDEARAEPSDEAHGDEPDKAKGEESDEQEKKGELSVTCTPTTAATINLKPLEHDADSYLCEIIPKEVGNHEISIKYNGRDVHNSPHYVQFEPNPDAAEQPEDDLLPLDVSIDMNAPITPEAKPDLSPNEPEDQGKVRVFGPGLSDGLVGQEGHFTIETEKAGEGKLEVDVQGPKGAFKINVRRHPDNTRTLLARYDPKIVGEYKIEVLWDGEHVSQSPYTVNINKQVVADETNNKTEEEPKENETESKEKEAEAETNEDEIVKVDESEM